MEQYGALREQYGALREPYGALREQYGALREQYGTLREIQLLCTHIGVILEPKRPWFVYSQRGGGTYVCPGLESV